MTQIKTFASLHWNLTDEDANEYLANAKGVLKDIIYKVEADPTTNQLRYVAVLVMEF